MPSGRMRRSKSRCLLVLVTQAVAEQQYASARTTAALTCFPVVPRALKNSSPSNPSKYIVCECCFGVVRECCFVCECCLGANKKSENGRRGDWVAMRGGGGIRGYSVQREIIMAGNWLIRSFAHSLISLKSNERL